MGYTTAPVLKVCHERAIYRRKRGSGPASVPLDAVRCVEVSTNFSTKFRFEQDRELVADIEGFTRRLDRRKQRAVQVVYAPGSARRMILALLAGYPIYALIAAFTGFTLLPDTRGEIIVLAGLTLLAVLGKAMDIASEGAARTRRPGGA